MWTRNCGIRRIMVTLWLLSVFMMIVACQGIKTNEKLSRNKRLTVASPRNLWTKGIIPYTFDDTLSYDKRHEYTQDIFPVFEKYSCIQFVPWTPKTSTDYGLDHDNYLIFVHSPYCASKVGNVRFHGQRITCCSAKTCLHEIGHAIGLYHEQTNPIRDDFVRIQYENIIPGLFPQFDKRQTNTDTHGIYDYDSIMHYAVKAWSSNQEPTIAFLDPSTKPVPKFANTDQYFYLFKEINEAYQCTNDCTGLSCYNGGYKAIIGGKCRCRCPEGLNPTTKCSTLLNQDYDCGKIVSLDNDTSSVTIQSPVIRRNDITTCYWYIKSPPKTRILLNFPVFHIHKHIEECEDEVAVKAYLPGMYGNPYCGHIFKKTVHSAGNILAFSFTQSPTKSPGSSFVARVSFIHENSYCYKLEKRGIDYAGTVNVAEDSSRCLPWDKVRHCPHQMFNIKDADKRLEANYCRNPDISLGPWCYINTEGCERRFCDACNLGVCKNVDGHCERHIKQHPGYCWKSKQAASICRKSCGYCNNHKPLPSVTETFCDAPELPLDAAPSSLKDTYSVGETVQVKCNKSSEHQNITCLSNGQWTQLNYVCGTCLPGWVGYGHACYKMYTRNMRQSVAEGYCNHQVYNAQLVVETRQNHHFLSELIKNERGECTSVWIGLRIHTDKTVFTWNSGVEPMWTNWDDESEQRPYHCVMIDSRCKWVTKICRRRGKFVCRYYRPAPVICANQRSDCYEIRHRNPDVCTAHRSFAWTYCAKTCGFC